VEQVARWPWNAWPDERGLGGRMVWNPHFAVLFSITQSLGGLAGPAVFGTFQVVREKAHSSYLTEQINPADPIVAQRLQLQGQLYAPLISDPLLRQAQGSAQLSQVVRREANVLAFNDVFRLIGLVAISVLSWSLFHILRAARQKKRESLASVTPPTDIQDT